MEALLPVDFSRTAVVERKKYYTAVTRDGFGNPVLPLSRIYMSVRSK